MFVFSATLPVRLPASHHHLAPSKLSAKSLTINTCKTVSKQSTLTPFRINTYNKTGEGGLPSRPTHSSSLIVILNRVSPSFATLTKNTPGYTPPAPIFEVPAPATRSLPLLPMLQLCVLCDSVAIPSSPLLLRKIPRGTPPAPIFEVPAPATRSLPLLPILQLCALCDSVAIPSSPLPASHSRFHFALHYPHHEKSSGREFAP